MPYLLSVQFEYCRSGTVHHLEVRIVYKRLSQISRLHGAEPQEAQIRDNLNRLQFTVGVSGQFMTVESIVVLLEGEIIGLA